MRLLVFVLTLLTILPTGAGAAGNPVRATTPADERGRQVLLDAVAALGGDKFLAVKDRVATGWSGTWYNQTSKLTRTTFQASYAADGSLAERFVFDKDGAYSHLFNADGGFEVTFRGARPVAADKLERYRRHAHNGILQILHSRLNEPGLAVRYLGAEVCENQSADVVEISSADEKDPVVKVCFSRVTHLPLRQGWFVRDPLTKDRMEEEMIYARFQDAGNGVLWPRAISFRRDGLLVSETFLETVRLNTGLDAAAFALPPNVKPVKALPALSRLI